MGEMFILTEQTDAVALPKLKNYAEFNAWMDYVRDCGLSYWEINEMLYLADEIEGGIL